MDLEPSFSTSLTPEDLFADKPQSLLFTRNAADAGEADQGRPAARGLVSREMLTRAKTRGSGGIDGDGDYGRVAHVMRGCMQDC